MTTYTDLRAKVDRHISPGHLRQAIDTLAQWVPEDSEFITHRDEIVQHIHNNTEPDYNSDLMQRAKDKPPLSWDSGVRGTHGDEIVQHIPNNTVTVDWNSWLRSTREDEIVQHIPNNTEPDYNSDLTQRAKYKPPLSWDRSTPGGTHREREECTECLLLFDLQAILFGIGLCGLYISNEARLARELSGIANVTNGLRRGCRQFMNAENAFGKAKALFGILGGLWNAGGFRSAFRIVRDEMSWWEWVKTAVISVLQFTVWFATDGAAFIAEVGLSIMSAELLIECAVNVGEKCERFRLDPS